ncbi:MAG: single-stranded-DNA-specific exonuclease RecJ, partial [Cyanobacteria bacterium J06632_22]
MTPPAQWQLPPNPDMPTHWVDTVQRVAQFDLPPVYGAQLLWQRGIRDENVLKGFLQPQAYQPMSPFAFGEEMDWAVTRLIQA